MLTDEQLCAELTDEFHRLMAMNDESFDMLCVASQDEIDRSLDQGDLVGELRGRYYRALCDAVARRR